jgi:hypothetical protein
MLQAGHLRARVQKGGCKLARRQCERDNDSVIETKYKLNDILATAQMKVKLGKIVMNEEASPDDFFNNIARVQNKYMIGGTSLMTEIEKIAMILAKAPSKYSSVITTEMTTKGNLVTADNIDTVMQALWRREHPEGADSELALSALCYGCGVVGHK